MFAERSQTQAVHLGALSAAVSRAGESSSKSPCPRACPLPQHPSLHLPFPESHAVLLRLVRGRPSLARERPVVALSRSRKSRPAQKSPLSPAGQGRHPPHFRGNLLLLLLPEGNLNISPHYLNLSVSVPPSKVKDKIRRGETVHRVNKGSL